MGDKFFFVDAVRADRNDKKMMRRHVMKGKNTGKKFHRASRLTPRGPQIIRNWKPLPDSGVRGLDTQEMHMPSQSLSRLEDRVARPFGDALHAFGLRVHISPPAMQVVNEFFSLTADRLYPIQLGLTIDDAKFMWLKVLFNDDSTYECNIAMMQACNEVYLNRGENTPKALYGLSHTVNQVRKRLQSSDALSDSTFTMVLSLINQEQLKQCHAAAKVHLQGLRKMIELRGGLEKLEGNLSLVLKACKVDIICCLQHGGGTMFYRDRLAQVREALASKGFVLNCAAASSPLHRELTSTGLRDILLDALSLSSFINNNKLGPVIPHESFHESLMSLFYRLLHLHPLDGAPQDSGVDAAYHIGLMLFAVTLLITLEKQRIIDCSLVSLRLQDVLDRYFNDLPAELGLWVAMIGGMWTSAVDGDWVLPKLREVSQRLQLRDWNQVRERITVFPWVDALHEQPGRSLWHRMHTIHEERVIEASAKSSLIEST